MEKFKDLEYVRPNFKEIRKQLKEKTKELKNAKTYKEARKVYFEVEEIMGHVSTQGTIVSIRNTIDKTDKFYENEDAVITKEGASLSLVMKKLIKTLLDSPFKKDIDNEFGEYLLKEASMSLKLIKLSIIPEIIKENKLSQQYSKEVALCKTNFRGEDCNFYGLLKHMESVDRKEREEAFHAWADMYELVSPKLDKLYDKLVALRVKKAKKLGFDNFIDYVYLARSRYDYNAKDVEAFRKQVRDEITPFCAELFAKQKERLGIDKLHWYDEALVFPEGNAKPIGTTEELVNKALNMYKELSPETGEFFQFMVDHELFDLETKPGKHMGGYCTFLQDYKAPFIFSNFNGTSADVDVLTHEAGHAFESFVASRTLPISEIVWSTSEINEIHSMTMEHFTYPWMESFFNENVNKYRYAHLVSSVTTIPYLVSVDEFQHRVFENPKMSAVERRKVWHEIEQTYMPWRDYDGNKFLEEGGFWMQKQHIFLYPFYYVDYALAQLCAHQLFVRSTKDRNQAWNDYLNLCKAGGSKGYFDLLKVANLKSPFADGTVKEVMDEIKKLIKDFEQKL